jgi:hypothetical protein
VATLGFQDHRHPVVKFCAQFVGHRRDNRETAHPPARRHDEPRAVFRQQTETGQEVRGPAPSSPAWLSAWLRRGKKGGHARHRASPAQGTEQPSREFAPANAPPRAANEAVQIRQAQRFLSAHDQIDILFHLRRDHVTAAEHRTCRSQTFQVWAEISSMGWHQIPNAHCQSPAFQLIDP